MLLNHSFSQNLCEAKAWPEGAWKGLGLGLKASALLLSVWLKAVAVPTCYCWVSCPNCSPVTFLLALFKTSLLPCLIFLTLLVTTCSPLKPGFQSSMPLCLLSIISCAPLLACLGCTVQPPHLLATYCQPVVEKSRHQSQTMFFEHLQRARSEDAPPVQVRHCSGRWYSALCLSHQTVGICMQPRIHLGIWEASE